MMLLRVRGARVHRVTFAPLGLLGIVVVGFQGLTPLAMDSRPVGAAYEVGRRVEVGPGRVFWPQRGPS
jgi:hypothetical protein